MIDTPITKYITAHQLAESLGVQVETVRDWTHKRIIPAHRMGKRMTRYIQSEVIRALMDRQTDAS